MTYLTKEAAQSVLDALNAGHMHPGAIALMQAAIDAPEQEPYGWVVSGCHDLRRGGFAEATAKAEAAYCGGTTHAFPVYRTAAPPAPQARELSDAVIAKIAKIHYGSEQTFQELLFARAVLAARSGS